MKTQPAALAKRMESIQPFHVMSLLGKAKQLEQQGRDIIHLEVGEPDFTTPQPIIDAGIKAIRQGDIHYTPSVGLPELREAIAADYAARFKASVSASQIIVTPGASGALLLIIGALIGRDDAVMLADPGYPCNSNFVRFVEGHIQSIAVDESSAYQLTAEIIEKYWQANTKAVLLASPSNPTGTLVSREEMQKIIALVRQKNGMVIVDEIYQGLVYDIEPTTVLSINQAVDSNVVVINSFSKYFQMTGWRLGWCVVPSTLVKACDHLAQNLFLAAPTTAQYAALAAFLPETLQLLEERRAIFKQRRDYLLPQLRKLGFEIPIIPQGAFYIYCDCSKLLAKPGILKKQLKTSMDLAHDLLETRGVAVTPGIDFGRHKADQYLRIAYTKDIRQLEAAVARLTDYLNEVS